MDSKSRSNSVTGYDHAHTATFCRPNWFSIVGIPSRLPSWIDGPLFKCEGNAQYFSRDGARLIIRPRCDSQQKCTLQSRMFDMQTLRSNYCKHTHLLQGYAALPLDLQMSSSVAGRESRIGDSLINEEPKARIAHWGPTL